ncbi:MAG TPA: hypothetical protein VHQ95_02295 [Pyrinomonadaceae bacterium]|nr:hypothetical protein [Pyrinomonadaceae bacterium]
MAKSRALKTILIAGVIAGIFDITYACLFNYFRSGVKPIQVLQSVASGALGREAAITGGAKTAALGLFFHFLIALIWATVFYLASGLIPFMTKHAVISGILYGLCVYLVMYGLVLRFSAIHSTRLPWSYPWIVLLCNLGIHMFGIGLPIALVTRKFSK